LTLTEVVRIRTERRIKLGQKPKQVIIIDIAGLDLCDGTPVLDIKPYVPVYDAVPRDHPTSLPSWVAQGLNMSRKVEILDNAKECLLNILESKPLEFYQPHELTEVQAAIVQVLSMDVRSTFQTNKARNGASHAERSKRLQGPSIVANDPDVVCTQQLDRLLIHFTVQETPPGLRKREESSGSGAEDTITITKITYLEESAYK
jgi:hypothetical protein